MSVKQFIAEVALVSGKTMRNSIKSKKDPMYTWPIALVDRRFTTEEMRKQLCEPRRVIKRTEGPTLFPDDDLPTRWLESMLADPTAIKYAGFRNLEDYWQYITSQVEKTEYVRAATDGSYGKSRYRYNGSGAVVTEDKKVVTFTIHNIDSVWDAEIAALILANKILTNSIIYTDSLSAVSLIKAAEKQKPWQKGGLRKEWQAEIQLITNLKKKGVNKIKFVKAHTDKKDMEHELNKVADSKAKGEAKEEQGIQIRKFHGRANWMTRTIKGPNAVIPTIEGWWIGGKTKEKIYKHILQRERGKMRTKAQEILGSSKFWLEPSYYMIKSRRTISNVYKVTQAILAGSLMTKSRIYKLTGQGSILCSKCTEEKEETIYHALGECKEQEENREKLRETILEMLGMQRPEGRWPVILDKVNNEEREDANLIKGILAGGVPIEWREILMRRNPKGAMETACRLSAMISKTIAAIWGERIGGERNDIVDYYHKRTYKINLWAESVVKEYYDQQQVTWEVLDEVTEGTGLENISEILDDYYKDSTQTQDREQEGQKEMVIGERIKRRRLGGEMREKWDSIPGIHTNLGDIREDKRQHFNPPELDKDFSKKYTGKRGCEHDCKKACKECAKEARRMNEEKRKLKKRKREEIEKGEGVEKEKRRKGDQDKEEGTITRISKRKGNNWRKIPTWGIILSTKEEPSYRKMGTRKCKYNSSYPQDRAPLRLKNNKMRAFRGYTRPNKKYKRPLNSNRSLNRIQEEERRQRTEMTDSREKEDRQKMTKTNEKTHTKTGPHQPDTPSTIYNTNHMENTSPNTGTMTDPDRRASSNRLTKPSIDFYNGNNNDQVTKSKPNDQTNTTKTMTNPITNTIPSTKDFTPTITKTDTNTNTNTDTKTYTNYNTNTGPNPNNKTNIRGIHSLTKMDTTSKTKHQYQYPH
eukprot:TRINITY_DN221_c0_g2_i1.p1 TRINITY_DN221_c0_g2~~TRINITY_DN221_c0_g2_i1.p1  ORF type:complete len:957 (+),score=177.77 TRINITY_DN221_c0_g2_i1:94-2871(+)